MINKKPQERRKRDDRQADVFSIDEWKPKTEVGKLVKNKEITNIDEIIDAGLKIYEPEIVDALVPELESDLLLLGQSKGKFGGGQRRAFKQTQKKTREGNVIKFSTCAVVGNGNGYVGIGFGNSKETLPAREKSVRNAKLNLIKIVRGSGSWESDTNQPHSIPFTVIGKCGSVEVKLMPAPKGTGLKAQSEIVKILKMAGIQDVWSKARGKTSSRLNLIKATFEALKKTLSTHTLLEQEATIGLHEGRASQSKEEQVEKDEE